MNEKKLIKRARKGDGEAISTLYQLHKEKVFAFVFYRVGVQSDAEDLFQEVMLAAFDSLERFRGEVPFLHWCYQIARNKVAMFWRQKAKQPTTELHDNIAIQEEEVQDERVHDSFEKQRQQILKVLDDLPPRYTAFLKLRFYEGKTFQECADAMGITKNNAKVLQNRALKKANKIALQLS